MKRLLVLVLALVAGAGVFAAQAPPPPPAPAPIVILVSIDGFRWDYFNRDPVPNLRALAARGVHARELVPSFPSFTFPNHYTIVTGLYPAHHGIVANTIDELTFPYRFTMSAETARDPRWWGGEPIWVTGEKQGRHTASMFWPGSEAPIGGITRTKFVPFDDKMSNADRVRQVLEWLALPEAERPTFQTLYFSEVDHQGHDAGPDSRELKDAVAHVDASLGDLVDGVRRLGLLDRTTLVVVSDHGMAPTPEDHLIYLDDYVDIEDTLDFVDMGAMLHARPFPGLEEAVYRLLKGKNPHLAIYRRNELPARYHYRDNPRISPILGVVDEGWTVTTHRRESDRQEEGRRRSRGAHGYDPRLKSMHGLFIAAGPRVRRGLVVAPFENIHIYDFLCALMDLKPAPNDGDPKVTKPFLR